jgi:hypothetical protein
MALFVLVPGAGGMAWYWHRVVPLLGSAGHEAIAVDLPGDDRDARGTKRCLVAQSGTEIGRNKGTDGNGPGNQVHHCLR